MKKFIAESKVYFPKILKLKYVYSKILLQKFSRIKDIKNF